MSKIPVAKGGFRSWLSKNESKTSKSVLYEQKYQDHHDRIRDKENMSDEEEQCSSSYVSMVNPRPTAEDYAKYDADRRLREKARDMRVAQRSASSSGRNSFSMTPEPKETSPASDQYFTPQNESDRVLDEDFVTPSTSKKEKRKERRTPGSSDVTPVSSKPPRYKSSDQQTYYTSCLSRKMEENFSRMQDLVFSGHSLQEARHQVLAETTREASHAGRSPRRSSRRTNEDTILVTRSSSQPPPFETLNMLPTVPRTKSPLPSHSAVEETPILRTSYVETLVATHQIQMQYADRVVVDVEKQMTKLESMKNLAALSRSPAAEEAKRRRIAAEALRKLMETEEQKAKKLEVIRELKDRIGKITNVQLSIHQLVSSQPFEGDPYNQRLLNSIDNWISLPFHEFDVQTAREMHSLQRKMMITIEKFKNVASLHRKSSLNRSLNTSRKSIAVKINPSGNSINRSTPVPQSSKTKEASTQVTARLAESAMTQTSPRRVGVEPLDLSSLQKANFSSQTTPPTAAAAVAVPPQGSVPVQPTSSLSMTAPTSTIADIDEMLKNIVLHNESLETVDPFSHFRTDISYPMVPLVPSEECTPRSGRVSLDSDSARRLSAGVSHFLEKIKKENESFDKNEMQSKTGEDAIPLSESGPPIQIESPSTSETSERNSDNQTPPFHDESEVELNVDDPNITKFEHEVEEEEEQRQLRENALTPTPPVETDDETVAEENQKMSLIDPEDEHDETKKFVNHDEFERSLEDEQFVPRSMDFNESADDSGFLLDNKPPPLLKSIFDNVSTTTHSSSTLQTDTPRVSQQADESTFDGMDMDDYCQKDFLKEIGPIMIQKAIEFQNELRGLDWISAQSVWQPPSFEDIHMDFYDHFDYFDSFSIIIWGAVVDLINRNYLKFDRKMTGAEEIKFQQETLEMLQREYGPESKKNEWCREVKMSKKLAGMMPIDLDYRYDVRRGLAETEKQKYQWQQVQMIVIADRYPRKALTDEINTVYNSEKEKLGRIVISSEAEHDTNSMENRSHFKEHEKTTSADSMGVSEV